MIYRILTRLLACFVLYSCNNEIKENVSNKTTIGKIVELSYAKKFTITKKTDCTVLELLSSGSDSIASTFILYKNMKPSFNEEAYYIKIPVKKIASMSSIYSAMLIKLNGINCIAGIDNVDYYNDSTIYKNVFEKKIVELSRGPSIEIEKTIALNPDLLLTFGMGNPETDVDKKLIKAGLPVVISLDHLEETPLGRAEWIKFFACFIDKSNLADSLFSITEQNYNELKNLTKNNVYKPTVMTEIKYGDTWYVPSSKSYVASLIADAGGEYFYKDGSKTGSTPLSFEMVYSKAKSCDVWLNQYNLNSKKELLSYDQRYSLFKSYKNNRLYNNNKIQNSKGYSNYWETGIMNPDHVLKDLVYIFSPQLLPDHELTYYKQIK